MIPDVVCSSGGEMNNSDPQTQVIAYLQELREDSSVYSVQWMTISPLLAGAVSPCALLARYLAHIRRFTFSVVRPLASDHGIEFRLLNSRTSIISFAMPVYLEEGETSSGVLRINGGVLVQPGECDRGELSFISEMCGEGVKVVIRLSDYCPLLLGARKPRRWRKVLYRLTQASIHKLVTVRFLSRLYRELAGAGGRVRVVRVKGTSGEDI